jgi:hypothetical protein
MRNCISHGDRLESKYFAAKRQDLGGDFHLFGVLTEAASFTVRHSLLKVLKDGLLENFRDSTASAAYFAAHGLSKKAIEQRRP